MICELRLALALGLCAGSVVAMPARAQSTPLVLVGGVFDSRSATAAPMLLVRWPLGDAAAISVSQLGWTSAAGFTLVQAPELRWQTAVELTPFRAHLSRDHYDSAGRRRLPGYEHTLLRVRTGEIWWRAPFEVHVHAVMAKHWIEDARWPNAVGFEAPFGGVETALVFADARLLDPFEGLIDGVKLSLRGEVSIGDVLSASADASFDWGTRVGPLLVHAHAIAFYVYLDTPASNVLIGGSWDVLGASALWGHPLGAFRLPHGAASTAGIDLDLVGPLRLGLRGSALVGASEVQGGLGLQLHAAVSGVHLFAGLGTDARTEGRDLTFSCGASAALLFLP